MITLIDLFILQKQGAFFPPQKKRVPKGERKGWPPKKYRMLLSTMKGPAVEGERDKNEKWEMALAKNLTISYSQYRNWKYEDSFKEAFVAHCTEFVDLAMSHVRDKINTSSKELAQDINNKPLSEFANYKPPKIEWPEFDDFKSYHDSLQHGIMIAIHALFDQSENLSLQLGLYDFFSSLIAGTSFFKFAHLELSMSMQKYMWKELRERIFKTINQSLLISGINELTQKRILILCNLVKDLIEPKFDKEYILGHA